MDNISEFNELIKNFEKTREYLRDFYIYGFKVRNDFKNKSKRTYDNERRRIESWLFKNMRWENSLYGKRVYICIDSASIKQNPLYSAWKSKSFTTNDIMLHFYFMDIFAFQKDKSALEITDYILDKYEILFEVQTVRNKLKEYEKIGILCSKKQNKKLLYSQFPYTLEKEAFYSKLIDAVKFFQETAPFGFIGSTILDRENLENDIFGFKHDFIAYTLEDEILLSILLAMKEKKEIEFTNISRKNGNKTFLQGVPLKIFVSTQTGRRYVCIYNLKAKRFTNIRLDSINSIQIKDKVIDYDNIYNNLLNNVNMCWGVSFGGKIRNEEIYIKLKIDEQNEQFILTRIRREGRGGKLRKIENNVFMYSKEGFDTNEMAPWIKTFIGRIISIEGTNTYVIDKIYKDVKRMYLMYFHDLSDESNL